MTWISLLRNKSDVGAAFQKFHKIVLTQYQRQIHTFQSDNGTEFMDQVIMELDTKPHAHILHSRMV